MYSRRAGGRTVTFGVSGKLWHGVLVPFDRETGSLWTQLDGRAIRGSSSGQRLEHVPSVFVPWRVWRERHPGTLVLAKPDDAPRTSVYAAYAADPERLFHPRLARGLGQAIGPKEVVFGARLDGDALAVPQAGLRARRIVTDTLAGKPVALLWDDPTGTAVAVVARRGGRDLELEPIDGEPATSRALDRSTGEFIDTSTLERLRVDRAYWYAWRRTVPGARLLRSAAER